MTKIRMILQMLRKGVPQKKICQAVHCSNRLVSSLYQAASSMPESMEELLLLSDSELETTFRPEGKPSRVDDVRMGELEGLMPEIIERLNRRHANVELVFEDYYKKKCPNGYGYTQFKKHVNAYRERHDYAYHNVYEPGREWQIDFAGDALFLTAPKTGVRQKLVVLVCVMPYSNLPFMTALPNATTEWFFHGLNQGLQYLGALPHVVKSDNMKQWVSKSDRYSLTFSEATIEWADFYGMEPTACRIRKPRDKGPVEGAVNQLYKYVYARLEGEQYSTLSSLNARIVELLDEYNSLPYKGSTRLDIFEAYEKPRMSPLPGNMYRFRLRKEVKLGSSYHVCVGGEHHFYSVPFKYVGQKVKVMWDVERVEVYVEGELVCMHPRSLIPYGYSTDKAHMPEVHKAYERSREMNAATFIEWGARIGPDTRWAVENLLTHTTFPQQAYGRCAGLLHLSKTYGEGRLEHACRMMREHMGGASYKTARTILSKGTDLSEDNVGVISKTPHNEDVRGASAYASPTLFGKEAGND